MRLVSALICCGLMLASVPVVADDTKTPPVAAPDPVEVTADESLEWYQAQRLYVARGNAKAVRGTMTVEADILTAHERDKAATAPSETAKDGAKSVAKTGNLDRMTAEGNVRITDPRQKVFGDRAVYDLDRKMAIVTGANLKYVTEHDVVTARDSLEYYEDQNLAVARGNAVADHDDRHVEGDVLTARFRQTPSGQTELAELRAEGNVTVVTGNDVSRGDRAVYDVQRNAAILCGHVRVTRGNTQLTGDVAEVDFTKGESRLLNNGQGGRVRALLTPETKASAKAKTP